MYMCGNGKGGFESFGCPREIEQFRIVITRYLSWVYLTSDLHVVIYL